MMSQFTVYHNPVFLAYRGDHRQIPPPTQPAATVTVPDDLTPAAGLEFAYARTQHRDRSWFNDPQVLAHLRSTSPGDLIAAPDGELHVVESVGFRPYRPRAIRSVHRLAAAARLLEAALTGAGGASLSLAAQQTQVALTHALAAAGYPESETPILWKEAHPGDLVKDDAGEPFRVIARDLYPKWRARRVQAHVPDGEIWIDAAGAWAVLVPVETREGEG
jgi:hypothetical protein